MADVPVLFTVAEAAETLRICKAHLYNLLAAGALPSCTIGTRRLIRADDLATFIDARMTQGTTRE